MVGDSAKDDVAMAFRAGALASVLLDSGRARALSPKLEDLKDEQRPTFVVRELSVRRARRRVSSLVILRARRPEDRTCGGVLVLLMVVVVTKAAQRNARRTSAGSSRSTTTQRRRRRRRGPPSTGASSRGVGEAWTAGAGASNKHKGRAVRVARAASGGWRKENTGLPPKRQRSLGEARGGGRADNLWRHGTQQARTPAGRPPACPN